MDSSLSKELNKVFRKQKFKINVSHKVTSVKRHGNEVTVTAEDKKGAPIKFKGDYCLVSVGRSPYTQGLNAESAGVILSDRGQIEVISHRNGTGAHGQIRFHDGGRTASSFGGP